MDTYKHHTVAWQLRRSTPTGLESLSACSGKFGDGDEATQDWTRGGDEASPTPIRLQGCSTTLGNLPRLLLGWTRHLHQASFRSVEVCRRDYKLLVQLPFIIKLWHCCDPDNLSPKVGHHLHLASIAVPRYRPQQAVATCCPNLVRRPRPLWCKISVLPHVAHGSATKSW